MGVSPNELSLYACVSDRVKQKNPCVHISLRIGWQPAWIVDINASLYGMCFEFCPAHGAVCAPEQLGVGSAWRAGGFIRGHVVDGVRREATTAHALHTCSFSTGRHEAVWQGQFPSINKSTEIPGTFRRRISVDQQIDENSQRLQPTNSRRFLDRQELDPEPDQAISVDQQIDEKSGAVQSEAFDAGGVDRSMGRDCGGIDEGSLESGLAQPTATDQVCRLLLAFSRSSIGTFTSIPHADA